MKKKTISGLFALLLCGSVLGLSACTDSGKTTFVNGWNEDPQIITENLVETTVYKVSSNEGNASYVDYKVSYDGTYTTTLKHLTQDGVNVYEYSTALNYAVTFTLANGTSASYDDYCNTKVIFKDATQGLTPIYSEKEFISHTPRNTNATKIEDCWGKEALAYKTVVEYGEKNNATYTRIEGADNFNKEYDSVSDKNKKKGNFNYSGDKLSYLDNEQLMVAFRAISKETTSATVAVYSPFSGMQKFGFSFKKSDNNQTFTYTLNGEEQKDKSFSFREATLSLDAKNSGPSYKVKVADSSSEVINTNRNMILEIQSPLSYNMGTIVYTLSSITYNK